MANASSQRSAARQSGFQAAVCTAALVSCAIAYVVLEALQPLRWPGAAVAATKASLLIIPWLTAFAMLLRLRATVHVDRANYETLLQDRDRVRTLIDSLPDFMYAKDVQGRFLLANRFCCEAMGSTIDQVVGKTDFDFYSREIANNFYEDEQKVIHSGVPMMSRQEEVIDRHGSKSIILTTKVPLRDSAGEIVGIMGIGRNITARVAAEEQLRAAQEARQVEMRERERIAIELRLAQKLESVGRLAAGIAHEINTPVQYLGDSVHFLRSAFDDFSKLLAAYKDAATNPTAEAAGGGGTSSLRALEEDVDLEFLSSEVPKAFERTVEGIERVGAIVRAMKEFAYPGTNEHKPADINHALRTTLTVARSEYRYAARVETEFGEIPEVVCNIGELNQVFLNLIVNSAHAIVDAGKDVSTGVIEIRTRLEKDTVQISIGDNGCGISCENLEKIFDPFFTTKEVGRGTGQGLAIARSIVADRHAGCIEASSERGRGTQFLISLPVSGVPRRRSLIPLHETGDEAYG